MLLRKFLPLESCTITLKGDNATFEGYASVFGGTDSYGDTIVRGAFSSTLRNNGMPKMFFNHDWSGLPIGKWLSAKEDDHGLLVSGEFTPGIRLADETRAAIKHQTLDGLSIGGMLKKGDFQETESGRLITKWSKLVEISPVVFPADGAARIDASTVKSEDMIEAIAEIETIRDFERFLRDAGGLSKSLTTSLVSRAKTVFAAGDPGNDDGAPAIDAKAFADLSAALKRFQVPASLT
jgi:uncharacterized protein